MNAVFLDLNAPGIQSVYYVGLGHDILVFTVTALLLELKNSLLSFLKGF